MARLTSQITTYLNEQLKEKKFFSLLFLLAAFLTWGLVPLYFDRVSFVPETDLLCYRILFSFLMVSAYLFSTHKPHKVIKTILSNKAYRLCLLSGLATGINWGSYIYSLRAGCILQGSFAYYIAPLLTITFAMVFLREKITRLQTISLAIASIGVTIAIQASEIFPYFSFIIASSFALYTLIRKEAKLDPFIALWLELLTLFPIAFASLLYLIAQRGWDPVVDFTNFKEVFWVVNAGTISFFPLLFFTIGIRKIKMTLVGALQYITPTCQFLLGIFVYQEACDKDNLIAYCFIWIAVAIFILSEFIRKNR